MLRINSKNIENEDDLYVSIDLETSGSIELLEYHKEQIGKYINEYLLKQLKDMWVQHNIRPENLSLNDNITFDRYAFPSYVSIDYKDNKTPLIPIVL